MPSIAEEIQSKFKDNFHRAQVNIIYTAAWINQANVRALRPLGLSVQQFNILRILRGRGEQPSTVKLLTERMLDKMSNASRLVDKLKEKGLVERRECETDRRRVDIVITDKGRDLVERASVVVDNTMHEMAGSISDEELGALSELLDRLRA